MIQKKLFVTLLGTYSAEWNCCFFAMQRHNLLVATL